MPQNEKPRGLEISHINMDAAAANEGNNMSVRGVSVGKFPACYITHQYSAKFSLEEADLYERQKEKMKKGSTASTTLKTATPPLNKGRAGIDQAAFLVGDCVEVAEDLSAGIPGRHFYGGIGYVTKVEGTGSNSTVSVKYTSTAKNKGTGSGITFSRVKAGVLPFQDMTSRPKRVAAAKPMDVESNQDTTNSTMPIIDDLKMNCKHKKGGRPNKIGVKKVYNNYDLSLDNDYSQMRAAIILIEETAKISRRHRHQFCEAYRKSRGWG